MHQNTFLDTFEISFKVFWVKSVVQMLQMPKKILKFQTKNVLRYMSKSQYLQAFIDFVHREKLK